MFKEDIIILDLDRTLVDSTKRTAFHFRDGHLDFKNLHHGMLEWDSLNDDIYNLFMDIFNGAGGNVRVFILSGRSKLALDNTWKWLSQNFGVEGYNVILKQDIILRDPDDYRTSFDYKKEELIKLQEKYNILWLIDDDPTVCFEAQQLGVKTLCYMSPMFLDDYAKKNMKKYLEMINAI